MKYFLFVIGKLLRICKRVIGGGLKLARAPGVYASSIATYLEVNDTKNHSVTRNYSYLCGGPMKTSLSDLITSVSEQIWERLEDILVKT